MRNKREIFSYLIFGVLTTVVNMAVYGFFADLLGMNYKLAVTIAWFISVLFAYITNKYYVFRSTDLHFKVFIKEMFFFFGFRVSSYFLDLFTMIVLVHDLGLQDLLSKAISNIGVVIFNYVASKFFVFRKSTKASDCEN